jgi:hypothetical protein
MPIKKFVLKHISYMKLYEINVKIKRKIVLYWYKKVDEDKFESLHHYIWDIPSFTNKGVGQNGY